MKRALLRLIGVLAAIVIALAIVPSQALAAYGDSTNIIERTNGTCRWYVTADNELILEPTNGVSGQMTQSLGNQIFYDRAGNKVNSVTKVTVKPGVKAPSNCADMFWSYFPNCETIDLSGFDMSSVTNMSRFFWGCYALREVNLDGLGLTQVTNMNQLCDFCGRLEKVTFGDADTSHVTTMNNMFGGCSALTTVDLENLDTSSVIDAQGMFNGCKTLPAIDTSNFDFSSVTKADGVFRECAAITSVDLSCFEGASLERVNRMFYGCASLESVDLTPLDTSRATNMSGMFDGCSSLKSLDLSPLETSNVTDMSGFFQDCSSLESIDLTPLDTSKVTNFDYMFRGIGCETLDVSVIDFSAATSMRATFSTCSNLTNLVMTGIDTSNVTDMSELFAGSSSLPAIDLAELDTQNVTTMYSMFAGTTSLKTIDLSLMDTSSVTNMSGMFSSYYWWSPQGNMVVPSGITTVDFSGNDLSSVTSMDSMFNGAQDLTSVSFAGVDTPNLTYTYAMFQNCTGLVELDLTGLDTQNVTNMNNMFYRCENLERVNVSEFDTSNVTNMASMFAECTSLVELDLSNFDMRQKPYCFEMMKNLDSIQKITVGENYDVSVWQSFPYPGVGDKWFSEKEQKWYDAYYIWNNRNWTADTYTTTAPEPGTPKGGQAMYRLYNRWTGEHFYTASKKECDGLVSAGWNYEGIGWFAPKTSNHPVYRLYNKWVPGGDHHYTMDAAERDTLVAAGWTSEGVGWYSDDWERVPLYRQYNPYASTGTHNYTTSIEENDHLVEVGWLAEGIGWYGMDDTKPSLVVSRVVIEGVDTSFAPDARPSFAGHTPTADEQSKHAHISEEFWYGCNSDYSVYSTMESDNDEVAIAGLTYTYSFNITLDQGATFAPTLTYVINGQEYTVDASYATYSNGVWSIHVWSDCKITCNAPASLVVTGVNDTLPEGTMPQPTAAIDPSCEFADEVSIYGESWLYETQEGEELLSRISMVAAFPAQGTECSYVLSLKLADGFTLPDTFELMVNGVACTGTVRTQLGYLPSMEGIVHVVTTYTTTVGAPVGSTDPVTLESLSIEGVATQLLSSTMPTFGASVTATTPEGAPVEVIDEAWGTLIVPSEGTSGGYSLTPLAAEPNIAWMGTYAPEVGSTLHYAFIVSLPDGSQITPDLTVNINGQPCTVLGVLSQTNSGPRDTATIFVDYSFVVQEG